MVCVHLAAKMHGLFNRWTNKSTKEGTPSLQTILSFRGLSALSQGEFSVKELSQMELVVLQSLNWNLRTTIHDVSEWIDILSLLATVELSSASQDRDAIREHAFHHVWIAVSTHRLLRFTPSQLAIALFKRSMNEQTKQFDVRVALGFIDLCNHVDEVKVGLIENEMQVKAQLHSH